MTILIEEYDRENWSTGSKLHSHKLGVGYGRTGTDESSFTNSLLQAEPSIMTDAQIPRQLAARITARQIPT